MKVILENSLFESDRTLEIFGIITICQRMGHKIVSDPSAVERWIGDLPPKLTFQIDNLLKLHRSDSAQLSEGTRTIFVHTGSPSIWKTMHIELKDASQLLSAPLELLVENERSDWHFLRRLAKSSHQTILDEAIARGALQLRQGGGISEVKKSVETLFDMSATPDILAYRRRRRLRTWVLFDRDADRTDARQPHQSAIETEDACQQTDPNDPWPLRFHRLKRRHIESYLPDATVRRWARSRGGSHEAGAETLIQLRTQHPESAYSMNMKKGLCADLEKSIRSTLGGGIQSPNIATRRTVESSVSSGDWIPPWANLSAEMRADLLGGFGEDICLLFETAPEGDDAFFANEFDRYEACKASELIESIVECI